MPSPSCSVGDPTLEIKKQISIFLPVSDWRRLRHEAARQRVPITELCRRWIAPALDALRAHSAAPPADD